MRSWQGVAAIIAALVAVVLANYLVQLPKVREERAAKEAEEKMNQEKTAQEKTKTPPTPSPTKDKDFGAAELTAVGAGANPDEYKDVLGSVVTLETDKGNIVLQLLDREAPITVDNFLRLSAKGFYDGTIFHRVEPGFCVQGGDPEGTGMGGPGYTIPDEIHANNHIVVGTLAMANAGPNTGGSQFFISLGVSSYLDKKHTDFGKVLSGMDVVEKIAVGDAIKKVVINKHWTPSDQA